MQRYKQCELAKPPARLRYFASLKSSVKEIVENVDDLLDDLDSSPDGMCALSPLPSIRTHAGEAPTSASPELYIVSAPGAVESLLLDKESPFKGSNFKATSSPVEPVGKLQHLHDDNDGFADDEEEHRVSPVLFMHMDEESQEKPQTEKESELHKKSSDIFSSIDEEFLSLKKKAVDKAPHVAALKIQPSTVVTESAPSDTAAVKAKDPAPLAKDPKNAQGLKVILFKGNKEPSVFLQKLQENFQPTNSPRKHASPVRITPPHENFEDFLILEDDDVAFRFSIPRKTTATKNKLPIKEPEGLSQDSATKNDILQGKGDQKLAAEFSGKQQDRLEDGRAAQHGKKGKKPKTTRRVSSPQSKRKQHRSDEPQNSKNPKKLDMQKVTSDRDVDNPEAMPLPHVITEERENYSDYNKRRIVSTTVSDKRRSKPPLQCSGSQDDIQDENVVPRMQRPMTESMRNVEKRQKRCAVSPSQKDVVMGKNSKQEKLQRSIKTMKERPKTKHGNKTLKEQKVEKPKRDVYEGEDFVDGSAEDIEPFESHLKQPSPSTTASTKEKKLSEEKKNKQTEEKSQKHPGQKRVAESNSSYESDAPSEGKRQRRKPGSWWLAYPKQDTVESDIANNNKVPKQSKQGKGKINKVQKKTLQPDSPGRRLSAELERELQKVQNAKPVPLIDRTSKRERQTKSKQLRLKVNQIQNKRRKEPSEVEYSSPVERDLEEDDVKEDQQQQPKTNKQRHNQQTLSQATKTSHQQSCNAFPKQPKSLKKAMDSAASQEMVQDVRASLGSLDALFIPTNARQQVKPTNALSSRTFDYSEIQQEPSVDDVAHSNPSQAQTPSRIRHRTARVNATVRLSDQHASGVELLRGFRSGPSSMIEDQEDLSLVYGGRPAHMLSRKRLSKPQLSPITLQPEDREDLVKWLNNLWSTSCGAPVITPEHFRWYGYNGKAMGHSIDLQYEHFSCGKLLLGSYMKKPLQVDNTANIVYIILTSSLSVKVNGMTASLVSGETFMVPCGHAYEMCNLSAEPAVLFYNRMVSP